MKGSAKSKVVTSGRLTGGVKGPQSRRRVTPGLGPGPAYSLYSTSTDSEKQVSSLHKGLDRCAALLTDILQADQADLPRAVKGVAARLTPWSALGKKTIRNTKTDQRGRQPVQPVPGPSTPAVKLHPPENQTSIHPPENQTSIHPPENQTSIHPPENQTSIHPPENQTSIHPPENQTSIHPPEKWFDDREEEFVPVRDIDDQSSAVRPTCTLKMSNMQLELGWVDKVPQDSHSREDCSAETDVEVKTVQYLLGELKALIAGQGSVAERLLSRLEQTVSSPLMGAGSSNIWTEPELLSLPSQNTQLHRRVKTLNQQLKQSGRSDPNQNLELLRYAQVLTLQEELSSAQSRLQEVQEDLAELRKAFEDTQSQLTDREAENALIQADLEATRSMLLDSEREKRELSSLAQQRILHGHNSSKRPPGIDGSMSDSEQYFDQYRPDPGECTDRITQFLMSLGQREPTLTEHVCVAAEREQQTPRDTGAHPDVRPRAQLAPLGPSHCLQEVPSRVEGRSRLSRWEVESMWSDRSTRSGSTFDTRDEVAFRDGLAALDASIASLQRTIHLDLGR